MSILLNNADSKLMSCYNYKYMFEKYSNVGLVLYIHVHVAGFVQKEESLITQDWWTTHSYMKYQACVHIVADTCKDVVSELTSLHNKEAERGRKNMHTLVLKRIAIFRIRIIAC